jgi:peptide/nickel transport system substrate-binding protein
MNVTHRSAATRGSLRSLAVATAVALATAGCGANDPGTAQSSSGATAAVEKGGTLTILASSTEINWDPAKSQGLATTSLGLVERRLTTWAVQPGKPATVVPDLATSTGAVSDGGATWTYTLKDGIEFEDGTPITSADVKYGVERSFAPELSGGLGYHKSLLVGGDKYVGPYKGSDLASIATPDKKTIVFHLNTAYGDWPWIASQPAFAPVPRAKDNVKTYTKQPVASGPYRVASTQEGVSVTLKRNEHWDPKTDDVRTAGPDTIVFSLGQDATVTAQRLIADSGADKDAFSATFVPPAQLAQAAKSPTASKRLVTSGAGALAYLAINTQRPGLDKVAVRQAIQYAADKQAFLVASGGVTGGQIATTLITPGIAGRTAFDLYPAPASGDVAKAKKLLAASGWTPSRQLVLLSRDDQVSLSQAQAIKQGLERAGLKVTIKSEAEAAVTDAITQGPGAFDLTISSWQPDFPSASGNIQPLFDSSQIGNGGYNLSRYSSTQADALIAQATKEVDPAKAGATWAHADRRILADAPVVPLIYTRNSFLHGSNVVNFFIPTFPAYPNYLEASLHQ